VQKRTYTTSAGGGEREQRFTLQTTSVYFIIHRRVRTHRICRLSLLEQSGIAPNCGNHAIQEFAIPSTPFSPRELEAGEISNEGTRGKHLCEGHRWEVAQREPVANSLARIISCQLLVGSLAICFKRPLFFCHPPHTEVIRHR